MRTIKWVMMAASLMLVPTSLLTTADVFARELLEDSPVAVHMFHDAWWGQEIYGEGRSTDASVSSGEGFQAGSTQTSPDTPAQVINQSNKARGKSNFVVSLGELGARTAKNEANDVLATVPLSPPIVPSASTGIDATLNRRSLAFIALQNGGSVVALDLRSGEVAAEIPVGPNPRGTTASPDGSFVFALSDTARSVYVIDTLEMSLVDTLNVEEIAESSGIDLSQWEAGWQMGNLDVSADGQVIYINGRFGGLIRIDRGDRTARAGDYFSDGDVDVTPGDERVLIGSYPALLELDETTLEIVSQIPIPANTVDVSDDGSVVAALFGGDVRILDLQSFIVTPLEERGWRFTNPPRGMGDSEIDGVDVSLSAGVLCLTRQEGNDNMHLLSIDLSSAQLLNRLEIGPSSAGVDISEDGSLIVTMDPTQNRVLVVDTHSFEILHDLQLGPTPTAYAEFIVTLDGS